MAASSCPFVHHSYSAFCLFEHIWSSLIPWVTVLGRELWRLNLPFGRIHEDALARSWQSSPLDPLPTHWASFCWPHTRHWHGSTEVPPHWAFVSCCGSKGFWLAWETKLLDPCLNSELNSSKMLRHQGSCSSSGSCWGQKSKLGMKHTHCLCLTLLSECANWSKGSVAARGNHYHNSPRCGFRQAPDETWLLPFLKHNICPWMNLISTPVMSSPQTLPQKCQWFLDRHGESSKREENVFPFFMEGKHRSIIFWF